MALTDNYVAVDLRYGLVTGYSRYISFMKTPTAPPPAAAPGQTCASQAVLRVSMKGPYKGVRLQLDYGEAPRLWTVDVSDSPTGDGYGGDNGTTSNMAEAHIHNRQLRVYGNGLPGYMDASVNGGHLLHVMDDVIKKGSRLWLDISDERLEIGTRGGTLQLVESPYLFTLSGQRPHYGKLEYDLYIGLNTVVAGDKRVGTGLCKVEISLYEFGKVAARNRSGVGLSLILP
nr:hypothetical protein BaRGS_012700 [Batillaria attramentaria]